MQGKIATVAELKAISLQECGEPLVEIKGDSSPILSRYMRSETGLTGILVRKRVKEKLLLIQKKLQAINTDYQLLVVDGYRPTSYQEIYFLKEFLKTAQSTPSLTLEELIEGTHQRVALPSVAGHPTGGAVDLTIAERGVEMDMGGAIADFTNPELLPTSSSAATPKVRELRIMLHDLMVDEGFAPFYGEWWHFSYGDREWAAFYGKKEAPFAPLHF